MSSSIQLEWRLCPIPLLRHLNVSAAPRTEAIPAAAPAGLVSAIEAAEAAIAGTGVLRGVLVESSLVVAV